MNNIDNNALTGFGAGTKTNITWGGTSLVLNAAQTTGTYLSPPFYFTDCFNTPLKYLSWTTTLPFGKELPATSEVPADYSAIIANLTTSLRGLWHFNEVGGTTFADSSGNALTGTISGGVTPGFAGKFQNAMSLDGVNGFVDFGNGSTVTGMGNYSISFWIYPTNLGSNQGLTRKTDDDSGQGYLVNMISGGAIQFSTVYTGRDTELRTSTLLVVNQWSHVVVTADGSLNAANSHVYINGTEAAYATTTSGAGSHSAPTTFPLQVGFAGPTYNLSPVNYFAGRFDEFANWNRILTPAEVVQIYRRGINRIKFQVRKCFVADCSDIAVWQGPDNTNLTFFTEINNNSFQNLGNGTVTTTSPKLFFSNFISLVLQNSQSFQYKAIFETDNTTYLPDLKSAALNH